MVAFIVKDMKFMVRLSDLNMIMVSICCLSENVVLAR